MTDSIPAKDIKPCIFCMEENSHARAYPVAGDPRSLYCPTCHMTYDITEYDGIERPSFRTM